MYDILCTICYIPGSKDSCFGFLGPQDQDHINMVFGLCSAFIMGTQPTVAARKLEYDLSLTPKA